jgi:hypothetical protein
LKSHRACGSPPTRACSRSMWRPGRLADSFCDRAISFADRVLQTRSRSAGADAFSRARCPVSETRMTCRRGRRSKLVCRLATAAPCAPRRICWIKLTRRPQNVPRRTKQEIEYQKDTTSVRGWLTRPAVNFLGSHRRRSGGRAEGACHYVQIGRAGMCTCRAARGASAIGPSATIFAADIIAASLLVPRNSWAGEGNLAARTVIRSIERLDGQAGGIAL